MRFMLSIQAEIADIESRAAAHGIDIAEVLERADRIHRKSWARWKSGEEPQRKKWRKVNEALDALIAEKRGAAA